MTVNKKDIENDMKEADRAHRLYVYWRNAAELTHQPRQRIKYSEMAASEAKISARLYRDVRQQLGLEP